MSDLTDKLRKKLALEPNMSGRDAMYVKGVTIEAANARLKPIHEKLLAVVEAAEGVSFIDQDGPRRANGRLARQTDHRQR